MRVIGAVTASGRAGRDLSSWAHALPRSAGHSGWMDPRRLPDPSGRPARPQRSAWAVIGTVLAVLLTIGGLAFIALFVLVVVAMNNFGSNK